MDKVFFLHANLSNHDVLLALEVFQENALVCVAVWPFYKI